MTYFSWNKPKGWHRSMRRWRSGIFGGKGRKKRGPDGQSVQDNGSIGWCEGREGKRQATVGGIKEVRTWMRPARKTWWQVGQAMDTGDDRKGGYTRHHGLHKSHKGKDRSLYLDVADDNMRSGTDDDKKKTDKGMLELLAGSS